MKGCGMVIARIKGGLGNQLFCYAAARRLALTNDAELVIDDVTGFVRDCWYRRRYALDHFEIPVRKATPSERLEPFERYRRGVMKWLSRRRPFKERRYLEQEGRDFDERLLTLRVEGKTYLDGLWQSERYFKDVEHAIREDLRIIPPTDIRNLQTAEEIRKGRAVALHVRWFDPPGTGSVHNVPVEYYRRAIDLMEERIEAPRYFVFSDNPEAAAANLALPESRVFFVSHNREEENAYADLWLMTQCRHFITGNSTFSWWGAWLGGGGKETVVICPGEELADGTITSWNFGGQIPESWLKI